MKEYKRLRNTKVSRLMSEFLDNHNRYKGSYFWTPPGHASGRRRMEFENSFSFKFKGKLYAFVQTLRCSCSCVYFTSNVYVDGVKKSIRVPKKLLASRVG